MISSVTAAGSLRVRLLAGTLVWIVASIIVAGWGLGSLFRQHVAEQFHAELKTHLDQLAAHLAVDAQGRVMLPVPLSDPRLSKPYSGLYWQIDRMRGDGDGSPVTVGLLRSRSLWDGTITVPADRLVDSEIHRHRVTGPEGAALGLIERRVVLVDEQGHGRQFLRLIVAADEQLMIEPVARFSGLLWMALGALGFGLVGAAVVQVMIGLAPLRRLRSALAAIRNGGATRLEGDFPAEIRPLVDEFNAVLAQNAEVVSRARTQAGNLAHALKTPLSVLTNASIGRDDELARLVAEQVTGARKQVDYHLMRARAAASVHLPSARTPLAPVVDGLLRVMRRVHADRSLELVLAPLDDALCFRGEEQDMQEMLGNLLDNACKWAARRVEIQATAEQGQLVITIDDDGQGIAAAAREAVMRRGVRADEQQPGSGLGLAIVDDLARLYGGRVDLQDSPLGGVRAVLTLPATA